MLSLVVDIAVLHYIIIVNVEAKFSNECMNLCTKNYNVFKICDRYTRLEIAAIYL